MESSESMSRRFRLPGGFSSALCIKPTVRPEAATVRYIIEAQGSTFTVRAFATGLLSAFGHNPTIVIPDFEGEILLNPAALDRVRCGW